VLGVLLVAIVGLRVEVLKLGSGVGAQIQQATLLESSDSVLRSQISALSDNQRIITLAGDYGMYMPAALDVHLVASATGTHLGAAARNVSAPSRTTFLSGLVSEQQAGGQGTQAVSSTTTSGVAGATAGTTSGDAVSATTDQSNASTTSADTTAATTSGLDTSASTTDATSQDATSGSDSPTTGGGSSDVNTGLPDTTATPNTSQTTDPAGSTTGSTTGGTGLAG
jgi:hypothetical protein